MDAQRAGLDAAKPVEQSPPVQPAGELRSAPEGAAELAGRPKDGPIAQSVELRTFKPGEGSEVDAALVDALRAATAAGQWEAVTELARALAARGSRP